MTRREFTAAWLAPRAVPVSDPFLDDLALRAFRYFEEQAHPVTGLVRDRARTDGSLVPDHRGDVASIAATGFGLTALCIGSDRGWIPPDRAAQRVRGTLRFLLSTAQHEHGWFYHFLDAATGGAAGRCEVSSIDTALLLAGVLTARQYFAEDPEIRRNSEALYRRVEFNWLLQGDSQFLSHGWRPDSGFIPHLWRAYSEHMILYLLAIGAPSQPIPASSWQAWARPITQYAGYSFISGGPLFIHQYSHAWIDFRARRDHAAPHTNYFLNSVAATHAHRAFCLDLRHEFPGYEGDVWGITASDSVNGYVAWGGPPRHRAIDGTVVPCAAAGSLMIAPGIALPALRAMRARYGDRIYGRYGFADAFHPVNGWTAPDVVGIDVGITLLSAENLRGESVWRWFMKNREIRQALRAVRLV